MRSPTDIRWLSIAAVTTVIAVVMACGGERPRSAAVASPSKPINSGAHETPPNSTKTFFPVATPTPSPSPSPSPSPVPTAPPTPGPIVEPFGQHETRPDDVPDPFDMFSTPLSFPCEQIYGNPGTEQWVRTEGSVVVPGRVRICLLGFAPSTSLDVSITGPDGRTFTGTPRSDADGVAEWPLTALPGRGMGTYRVEAQQGTLVAETTIEAIPPESPRSLVNPDRPRLGQVVTIWFGGLSSGTELPAHLFQQGGNNKWDYVTGLGTIQVDNEGFAMIRMQSRKNDPADGYLLVAGPNHVLFTLRK